MYLQTLTSKVWSLFVLLDNRGAQAAPFEQPQ